MTAALQYVGGKTPPLDARPIRIMLVDDSAVARSIFARILQSHGQIEIVAEAENVASALGQLEQARPDIVLLDIEMPERSGLDGLPEILARRNGVKVLILSAIAVENGPAAIQALQLGACDTLAKPGRAGFGGSFASILTEKVVKIGRSTRTAFVNVPDIQVVADHEVAGPNCIAIGASTGGIPAISGIIQRLDPLLSCPVFITQHLPATFMPFFARQLDGMTERTVQVAEHGMPVRDNHIYLAPGDGHLICVREGSGVSIRIADSFAASHYCPSVDAMLESIAEAYGAKALAIVLSGMGNDGASGARFLRQHDATIVVQDPKTSVVWGMPGSVARQGIANAVMNPDQISIFLQKLVAQQ